MDWLDAFLVDAAFERPLPADDQLLQYALPEPEGRVNAGLSRAYQRDGIQICDLEAFRDRNLCRLAVYQPLAFP
jgi:hypothetical protein